ncbi:MAG: helix-turn-helix domain-containing protein [Defluviitaleaceae bacterium]|nr:helix-turn-helix domain-containing protein [Defluviitaleaceae bacterium]
MKELDWKEVAVRLRTLRKEHRLTIERLAEMVNVSTSFIGLVEKGESGVSLENLYKLSQVYNCSIDYLVTGDESNNIRYANKPLSQLSTAFFGYDESELSFVADLARFIRANAPTRDRFQSEL